jgi:hypothetical protein
VQTASTVQSVRDISILVREVDPGAGATAGGHRDADGGTPPGGLIRAGFHAPGPWEGYEIGGPGRPTVSGSLAALGDARLNSPWPRTLRSPMLYANRPIE